MTSVGNNFKLCPPNFLIFVPRGFLWRILRRWGCLWTPLGHQNVQPQHMAHYIQSGIKSGHDAEFWIIQRPERPHNFPGTGRQNSELSRKKIGTVLHLIVHLIRYMYALRVYFGYLTNISCNKYVTVIYKRKCLTLYYYNVEVVTDRAELLWISLPVSHLHTQWKGSVIIKINDKGPKPLTYHNKNIKSQINVYGLW